MTAPPTPDILPYPTQTETSISDGDTPAPPIHLPHWPLFPVKSVRTGAWLVNYTPLGSSLVAYDGTLRVEAITGGRRASGDLYQRPTIRIPFPVPRTILLPPPNPADGIPVQAKDKYRYYLRVTKILEGITFGSSFQLGLELFLFSPTVNGGGAGTWSTTPIKSTSTLQWIPAPAGYPSSHDYRKSWGQALFLLDMSVGSMFCFSPKL